jgi:hypothetical protein
LVEYEPKKWVGFAIPPNSPNHPDNYRDVIGQYNKSLHKQHPNSLLTSHPIKCRNGCFDQSFAFCFQRFPLFQQFGIAGFGAFVDFRDGAFAMVYYKDKVGGEVYITLN